MTAEEFKTDAARLRVLVEGVARRYLKDDDEAADATQDVMAKLWLMHGQLRRRPDALAQTVTRNLCLNRLRHDKCLMPTTSLFDMTCLPDDAESHEQMEQMMRIIGSLPSAQQVILHMRHAEERSMDEIAAVLGCTETAARKALSRARMTVRKMYMKSQDV